MGGDIEIGIGDGKVSIDDGAVLSEHLGRRACVIGSAQADLQNRRHAHSGYEQHENKERARESEREGERARERATEKEKA